MNRHSNDERATVLEKASSRDVFEKASSMSAKLAKSSSELDRKNEFVKFPFDSVLLETKVYRRVCESSWIREVSTALEDGNESDGSGPASIVSVSSNSAIASEGDCASSSRDLGVSGQEPGHARDPTIPVFSDCIYPRPGMPMLELSSTNSSEQTGEFSSTSPTKSTLATTSSSIDGVGVGRDIEDTGKDNTVETPSTHVVSVVVEEVGTDSTELALHETPDHYDKTQETIRHIRDRVLLAGGVDPGTYSGACVSSTIETTGRSEVHRFPLTPEFLTYAVNKVRDGFYDSFEILARFSSPNQSSGIGLRYPCNTPTGMEPAIMPIREGEAASLVQMALSTRGEPHHLDIPSHASLPFIESLRPEHRAKGGFSDVWRVAIHPAYLDESPARQGETQYFAVKRFRRDASATAMFHREVTVLKAISGPAQHPHITQLLGTFHWRGSDHLLLPWAEGNLQDFWRSRPGPAGTLQPEERRLFVSEVLEQLLGLADALKHLHLRLNSHSNARAEDVEQGITHGRHGDIKPQNILWFREPSASQRVDRLKLADLGLASFHNSEVDPAYPETRGGTETYGAPELKHHSPGQRLTSAYDVWSLGCVFIEAAIWVCMGPKGVDAFKRSRCARPSTHTHTHTQTQRNHSKKQMLTTPQVRTNTPRHLLRGARRPHRHQPPGIATAPGMSAQHHAAGAAPLGRAGPVPRRHRAVPRGRRGKEALRGRSGLQDAGRVHSHIGAPGLRHPVHLRLDLLLLRT